MSNLDLGSYAIVSKAACSCAQLLKQQQVEAGHQQQMYGCSDHAKCNQE
jgi:hypothetical protein